MRFLYLDRTPFYTEAMSGRWASSPEPIPLSGTVSDGETFSVIDLTRMSLTSRVDIPAGEGEDLDIAARCDDESDAYGFNNKSYSHQWRNPAWKLPKGRYLVAITVRSEGQHAHETFLVNNDLGRDHFRLEPVRPDVAG